MVVFAAVRGRLSEAAVQMPGHTRPSGCLTSGIPGVVSLMLRKTAKTNFGFGPNVVSQTFPDLGCGKLLLA